MTSLKRIAFCAALLVTCAMTSAFAGNVFVLPLSQSDTSVPVYSDNPFQSVTQLTTAAGAVAVWAKPDGSKFYVVSRSSSRSIDVLNSSLSSVQTIDLGGVPRAAAMSPDGTRLLVLGDTLRVFDLTTPGNAEITPSPAPDVGLSPSDLVFSVDSRRAFILSTASKTVTVFDLGANSVVGTAISVSGANAIAAAPNGQIYVSATNSLTEIDGSTGELRAQIALNGLPGKAAFTPDGNYALLANQPPFIPTGLAFLVDLKARAFAGVLSSAGGNAGQVLSQLAAADNATFYGVSTTTQQLIRITVNPADTVTPLSLATTGFLLASKSGVRAVALSNEQPQAKYIYAAAAGSISQGVLSSSLTQDLSLSITPGALQLAGMVSTAIPTGYAKFNDAQTVAANGTSQPLILRLWGPDGLPVFGKTVTFSTDITGVTIETPAPKTTIDGFASTRVTVPSVAGQQIPVNVSIDGWSGNPIAFTLIVGGGGGGAGTGGFSMYSGNGQVTYAGSSTKHTLRVILRSASGQPIVGETVAWSVTSGTGNVSHETSQTDANGIAEAGFSATVLILPPTSYLQSTVSAQVAGYSAVNFTVTTARNAITTSDTHLLLPIISSPNLTGQAGETLAAGVRVSVADGLLGGGVGIPNVGVSLISGLDPTTNPSATCVGEGMTALSDVTGMINCDVRLGAVVGGPIPLVIDVGGFTSYTVLLTVTPGLPGLVSRVSGNNQAGDRGATLPLPLRATVSDGFGNLLSGVAVSWQVIAGTASLVNPSAATDSQGGVSATVRLGNTPGPVQVKVSAGVAEAVFTLSVNAVIGGFTAVSGDGQTAIVGTAFASPLVVAVRDNLGGPLAGLAVTFQVTSGSATLGSASSTTGSNGQASTTVIAGATSGPVVIVATLGSQHVTFNLTAVPPGPVFSAAGVVNAISGDPGVSPGGIIAIYGQGIAPDLQGSVVANKGFPGPLPTTLESVQVLFGTTPAPIYHVSNINGQEFVVVQAPFTLSAGVTSVTVKVGDGSATINNVSVKAYQPGIFETLGPLGQRWAVVTKLDGTFVTPDNPVRRGTDTKLRLYCAGLGQATPALGTGAVGIEDQTVAAPLVVAVNNSGVRIISAETMVGVVGAYVVTFEVPADTTAGLDRSLAIAIANADGSPSALRYYSAISSIQ